MVSSQYLYLKCTAVTGLYMYRSFLPHVTPMQLC